MIVVNTSFHVDEALDEFFHRWVSEVMVPVADQSSDVCAPSLLRIIHDLHPGIHTYAVQLHAQTEESAQRWVDGGLKQLLQSLSRETHQQIVFFTTLMEQVAL